MDDTNYHFIKYSRYKKIFDAILSYETDDSKRLNRIQRDVFMINLEVDNKFINVLAIMIKKKRSLSYTQLRVQI